MVPAFWCSPREAPKLPVQAAVDSCAPIGLKVTDVGQEGEAKRGKQGGRCCRWAESYGAREFIVRDINGLWIAFRQRNKRQPALD